MMILASSPCGLKDERYHLTPSANGQGELSNDATCQVLQQRQNSDIRSNRSNDDSFIDPKFTHELFYLTCYPMKSSFPGVPSKDHPPMKYGPKPTTRNDATVASHLSHQNSISGSDPSLSSRFDQPL
jgi:hypothetical protein